MDALITFMRAQLDADERAAQALAGATRFIDRRPDFYGVGGPAADAYWDHFVPSRALAEVGAKRQVLGHLEMWLKGHDPERADEFPGTTGGVGAMLTVVRTLALGYADRPGYREEWRPREETDHGLRSDA
jgi:hypothetical protein